MASAGARAYNGGLGAEPPGGLQGLSPWSGGQGAKPPEAEILLDLFDFKFLTPEENQNVATF